MNWVIISDELGAIGWRLAGAEPLIADEHSVGKRLAEVRGRADLVLVTADLAKHLPQPMFDAALLEEKPLIAVVESRGEAPPDLEREVKRVLGIAV
jgi:vacuolar-type H+-ATPase subunit F/Vma7